MTIKEVVSILQKEKLNNLPSRFPCRAIMVNTVEQYCQLLSELKKISDIRVVKTNEIFSSADVMPKYSNLSAAAYRDEWVILTGVSEYLRLFSKKEATDRRFAALWSSQVPASSLGRIIIPLWGCEAQWFDSAINLNGDLRQEDFFFDCTDDEQQDQEMNLLVLSGMFEQHISEFKQGSGTLCVGLQEWFEYWENPSVSNTKFVLLTKRFNSITSISGKINVHVVNDTLSFIQENMPGGQCLTKENCSDEMRSVLFSKIIGSVLSQIHKAASMESLPFKNISGLSELNVSFTEKMDLGLFSPLWKWGRLAHIYTELIEFQRVLYNIKNISVNLQAQTMEFTIKTLEIQNAQLQGVQLSPTVFENVNELRNLINIRTAKLHEYVTGQTLELENIAKSFYSYKNRKCPWEMIKANLMLQVEDIVKR